MGNIKITYGIGGIYSITNKINGKRNIGGTTQPFKKRWNRHINLLNKGKHFSKHLQAAWNKYGKENFIFEIIVENRWKTEKKLREIETLFINIYKSYDRQFGYNTCSIAGTPPSRQGTSLTEEHKKKISESQKGEKGFWFDKSPSEETRQKISKATKGIPHSKEHTEKIRKANIGKTVSKESREKMSKSKTGRKLTEEHKKNIGKSQIGKHTGEKGTGAKLKWTEVKEIRIKFKTGNYTYQQLANEYKIGISAIHDIIKNKTWKE